MASTPGPREPERFPPARRVPLPAWRDAAGTEHAGLTLAVHEAGASRPGQPPVVLCHGFPELAYSWRHQLAALAAAGFRAIAPDQRGYGHSDCPADTAAYGIEALAADLIGLLDALGIERAVFAGHDWGGFVAWAMPLLHPARTAGVIGVNTPYIAFPPTALLRRAFLDEDDYYVLWFQKPGVAESVLDRDPRKVIDVIMRRARGPRPALFAGPRTGANPFRRIHEMKPVGPVLLTEHELDTYAAGFAKSGFAGGIRWYRNLDANAQRLPGYGRDPIDVPCLMVTAEWDAALPPQLAAGMEQRCSDLETHMIAACGHWTQQEEPEQLNRILIDWLGS